MSSCEVRIYLNAESDQPTHTAGRTLRVFNPGVLFSYHCVDWVGTVAGQSTSKYIRPNNKGCRKFYQQNWISVLTFQTLTVSGHLFLLQAGF